MSPTAGPPDPAAEPSQALIQQAAQAAGGDALDSSILERLVDQAGREPSPKTRARLQAATAILASLGGNMTGPSRARFAAFDLGRTDASAARLIALSLAAGSELKGETALLALQMAQAGGAAGPATADRCWIIRALARAGLKADAKAFAAAMAGFAPDNAVMTDISVAAPPATTVLLAATVRTALS